jgi:hypothetical protein
MTNVGGDEHWQDIRSCSLRAAYEIGSTFVRHLVERAPAAHCSKSPRVKYGFD